MTGKKWGLCLSVMRVGVLASLVGLITLGCTNSANSPVGESTQQKDSAKIDSQSENIGGEGEENATTLDPSSPPSSAEERVSLENSQNSVESLGLYEGMPYGKARNLLIKAGWQPSVGEFSELGDSIARELFNLGYEEVKSCAGTGLGPCRFEFTNERGELLAVSAITQGSNDNSDRFVWRWFIEEERAIAAEPSAIPEGFYVLGGTDQGLEVRGQQYRYYDESDIERPWQPISELKQVKEGLIFDGENYWCLPPRREPGVCTPEGWNSIP